MVHGNFYGSLREPYGLKRLTGGRAGGRAACGRAAGGRAGRISATYWAGFPPSTLPLEPPAGGGRLRNVEGTEKGENIVGGRGVGANIFAPLVSLVLGAIRDSNSLFAESWPGLQGIFSCFLRRIVFAPQFTTVTQQWSMGSRFPPCLRT